ncbi:LysR substrate-binding domain-containing protein [Qipengyuania sp. DGS5-3]|uniref:LysR substrate-binding domain-containing protein n=1 Tax=Qipengyuania sp. DGS5-3 TaxID=3349632 RepID=UPI0036D406E5
MNDENNSSISTVPSTTSLMAFERAAAHLSFIDAAVALGRTPSAISHAVRALEQQIGVSLFERVGRTVRLTNAGADYCEAIRPALRELELATIQAQRARQTNVVRISALPFFTSTVLLPNLAKFEEKNPSLELKIETSNAFADIRRGEADIALRFGSGRSQGLTCKSLVSVRGLPVASPQYLQDARPLNHPRDILNHTLIHVRASPAAWQDWLTAAGCATDMGSPGLAFDSILGALDAAENGHGIALAMDPLIRRHPSFGTRLTAPLNEANAKTQDYNFLCQESHWLSPNIQKTYRWLQDCVAEFADA